MNYKNEYEISVEQQPYTCKFVYGQPWFGLPWHQE